MRKKSLFLFFILLTGLISSSCKAHRDIVYLANDAITVKTDISNKVSNLLSALAAAGILYGGEKIYVLYKERQKRLTLAARTATQIVEGAALFYKESMDIYSNMITSLKQNPEFDITKKILGWYPEGMYPFLFEHENIKETFLPTALEYQKSIQECIDKNELKEELLAQAQMLLPNLDDFINNLKKIDQFIVTSNNFYEEKKHKRALAFFSYMVRYHLLFSVC